MRSRGTLSDDGARYWDSDGNGWQPLWLTAAEIRQASLTCYGIEAPTAQFLPSGMLNQSWRIGEFVLRVSRAARTKEQLLYEHTVLSTLHQFAPEVLAPVAGIDGHSLQRFRRRWLTMVPYVEGVPGRSGGSRITLTAVAPLEDKVQLERDVPAVVVGSYGLSDHSLGSQPTGFLHSISDRIHKIL